MVTKNYIKTLVSGLLTRIKMHEISEKDLISLLSEMHVVTPILNNEGSTYTDNNGKIYIL